MRITFNLTLVYTSDVLEHKWRASLNYTFVKRLISTSTQLELKKKKQQKQVALFARFLCDIL